MKIIIAITGASGAHLGIKAANAIAGILSQTANNQNQNAINQVQTANTQNQTAASDSAKIAQNAAKTAHDLTQIAKNPSQTAPAPTTPHEVALIVSNAAKKSLLAESAAAQTIAAQTIAAQTTAPSSPEAVLCGIHPAIKIYDDADLAAPPSSGSALFDAMLIAPCSANTLAKISCGIADSLILRAACVLLKERRRLILGVRESPLGTIMLRQMADLSALGAIIAPPVIGYYAAPGTLADMEDFIIGKWLDQLAITHDTFRRWTGAGAAEGI